MIKSTDYSLEFQPSGTKVYDNGFNPKLFLFFVYEINMLYLDFLASRGDSSKEERQQNN